MPVNPFVLARRLRSGLSGAELSSRKPIERRFREWARGHITEESVIAALLTLESKVPDFDHLRCGPFNLHGALQEFLDLEIRPEMIRDDCHEVARRRMLRRTLQGGLLYVPGTDHLKLEIPATSLPEVELPDLMHHELSHLLLGHALPLGSTEIPGEAKVKFWTPPASACPNRPPFDPEGHPLTAEEAGALVSCFEGEAERATRHLRSISAYGRDIYQREDLILGL